MKTILEREENQQIGRLADILPGVHKCQGIPEEFFVSVSISQKKLAKEL